MNTIHIKCFEHENVPYFLSGALFSCVSFLQVLCDLVGHSTFNLVYASTLATFRGAVFLYAAAIFAVAFILSM